MYSVTISFCSGLLCVMVLGLWSDHAPSAGWQSAPAYKPWSPRYLRPHDFFNHTRYTARLTVTPWLSLVFLCFQLPVLTSLCFASSDRLCTELPVTPLQWTNSLHLCSTQPALRSSERLPTTQHPSTTKSCPHSFYPHLLKSCLTCHPDPASWRLLGSTGFPAV